ncbi:MAG: LytR/AlgR family response regulator transcription factor [Lachnospiraceae bacterium]
MQRNILIVEDNRVQLDRLSDIVLGVDSDICLYAVTTSEEAYKIALEHTIDCFFVDIILDTGTPGDTSGAKFVSRIRQLNKYYTTPVFIITSLMDPTYFAYTTLHCMDYIEKPFDEQRIIENTRKVLQMPVVRENDKIITFRKDGIIYPVICTEIKYIKSKNHILYIYLADDSIFEVQYRSCQSILDEADSGLLLQCSRSTIVNIKYIESVDLTNRYIKLKGKKEYLTIGIAYKKKIAGVLEK